MPAVCDTARVNVKLPDPSTRRARPAAVRAQARRVVDAFNRRLHDEIASGALPLAAVAALMRASAARAEPDDSPAESLRGLRPYGVASSG